ncbi:MAG: flagellar transcriptional regulator FlhD [Rhodocyclaceae bacterium]|nr:flagellar transcriptional regulator FlhD [Rhodocyclaceae bacterium]MBX3670596.1 flagellar transcriptional regulator FlhD [Rhodocyclaceae bacterium]
MASTDMQNEIKELNLSYLMLAQHMLREDRAAAMFRLGVSVEIAELIENLTPSQLLRMAGADLLLARFRFDDRVLVGLLSNHETGNGVGRLHATIIAASKPLETLA